MIDDRPGDEARALERDLAAARERAEALRELNETKDTFLAAVSHDLRTPLAAILGLALTIEKQALDPEQVRELAGRIASNARRLDRIVSDLLDLDRIARGMVAPEARTVRLGAAVAGVVGASGIAEGRELSIEIDDVAIEVDEAMLERIVENLLANAVRHTPAGSRIWIRVEPEGEGELIVVEDEGPGVPPEEREEIFDPVRHADVAERAGGVGTGIGLALVARFAELQGGRAWVEDGEHGGASFRVWLPARTPR